MSVENSKKFVRVGSALSEPFRITSGLKQGDAVSPILFNFALDKAVRNAETTMQIFAVDGRRLLIFFVDDFDIITKFTIAVRKKMKYDMKIISGLHS